MTLTSTEIVGFVGLGVVLGTQLMMWREICERDAANKRYLREILNRIDGLK